MRRGPGALAGRQNLTFPGNGCVPGRLARSTPSQNLVPSGLPPGPTQRPLPALLWLPALPSINSNSKKDHRKHRGQGVSIGEDSMLRPHTPQF